MSYLEPNNKFIEAFNKRDTFMRSFDRALVAPPIQNIELSSNFLSAIETLNQRTKSNLASQINRSFGMMNESLMNQPSYQSLFQAARNSLMSMSSQLEHTSLGLAKVQEAANSYAVASAKLTIENMEYLTSNLRNSLLQHDFRINSVLDNIRDMNVPLEEFKKVASLPESSVPGLTFDTIREFGYLLSPKSSYDYETLADKSEAIPQKQEDNRSIIKDEEISDQNRTQKFYDCFNFIQFKITTFINSEQAKEFYALYSTYYIEIFLFQNVLPFLSVEYQYVLIPMLHVLLDKIRDNLKDKGGDSL